MQYQSHPQEQWELLRTRQAERMRMANQLRLLQPPAPVRKMRLTPLTAWAQEIGRAAKLRWTQARTMRKLSPAE